MALCLPDVEEFKKKEKKTSKVRITILLRCTDTEQIGISATTISYVLERVTTQRIWLLNEEKTVIIFIQTARTAHVLCLIHFDRLYETKFLLVRKRITLETQTREVALVAQSNRC